MSQANTEAQSNTVNAEEHHIDEVIYDPKEYVRVVRLVTGEDVIGPTFWHKEMKSYSVTNPFLFGTMTDYGSVGSITQIGLVPYMPYSISDTAWFKPEQVVNIYAPWPDVVDFYALFVQIQKEIVTENNQLILKNSIQSVLKMIPEMKELQEKQRKELAEQEREEALAASVVNKNEEDNEKGKSNVVTFIKPSGNTVH